MQNHEFLGHTADVILQVEATDKKALFQEALLGMSELLSTETKGEKIQETITCQSPDETFLLLDFLNQVLTLSHIHRVVFRKVAFSEFEPTKLSATISGVRADHFEKDVKAATYHGAEISKEGENFCVRIIFDI